ncbi:MAG: YfhO family protein [Clostridia bacterium]|nr:YfhO family protein [Clostridia bacterium]
MKRISYRNRALAGIAAFVLPVLVLLIVYRFLRIYPFGENSVLFTDLRWQYISFLSYYRKTILDGGSLLYTFSKNLGGDMIGLGAYYLSSPLNLLLLPLDTARLPLAVMGLQLMRIGLCGLTMHVFLNREGARWSSLLFSSAYALMAYTIVHSPHILWMDAVILLPIVVLGIEKLYHKRSPFVYIVSLGLAIIANYYTGFMLCLFSALYFCYLLFFGDPPPAPKRKRFSSIIRFGWASLLAGGLSAFVTLPLLHSLQGGKAVFSLDALRNAFSPNFHLFDLFSKFYIGSYSGHQMEYGLPNVYGGMLVLLFCIVFFVNGELPLRKRLGSGLLVFILCASFYVGAFNQVWHGFASPTGFPYRYSFLFSFLLISVAFQGYKHTRPAQFFKLCIPIFVVILLVSALVERFQYAHLNWVKIYASVLFLVMIIVVLYATHPKRKKTRIAALLCICLLDLGANAYLSLSWADYANHDEYAGFVQANEPIVDAIQSGDSSLYRMEKTYQYSHNDAMLLRYRGLSHFSSSEKRSVKAFMGKMGFSNIAHWAYYDRGSTVSVDSLLGVKYLLTKEETAKPYTPLWQQGDTRVYQNPYALPLGFLVHENALTVDMDEENVFALQNNLWAAMVGEPGGQLFHPAQIEDVALTNLSTKAYEGGVRYFKQDKEQDASIVYSIRVTREDPLYAYLLSDIPMQAELFVNGRSLGAYFDIYRWDIVDLGNHDGDALIDFTILLGEDDVYISDSLFYYQDMGVFADTVDALSACAYRIDRHTDARIEGTIVNPGEKKIMLTTIPYDEGWSIRINERPVPAIKVFGALLAFEAPEGEHRAVLEYVPPYLYAGLAITALSFGILIVLMIIGSFTRRKGRNAD